MISNSFKVVLILLPPEIIFIGSECNSEGENIFTFGYAFTKSRTPDL